MNQVTSASGVLTDQLSNYDTPFPLGAHPTTSDAIEVSSSHEDGIKKSLIIDMKDLVGDAVGNVRSIRPVRSFSDPKVDEHQSLIP
jgi:hypothetical protein